MIINLIGQPHSGKTTLSNSLKRIIELTRPKYKVFQVDGDEMRRMFKNTDYSETGRRSNIEKAYVIAKYLHFSNPQNIILISLVSPFVDLREDLKKETNAFEFYIKTTQSRGREAFHVENYQEPESDFVLIDTDFDEFVCLNEILETINI